MTLTLQVWRQEGHPSCIAVTPRMSKGFPNTVRMCYLGEEIEDSVDADIEGWSTGHNEWPPPPVIILHTSMSTVLNYLFSAMHCPTPLFRWDREITTYPVPGQMQEKNIWLKLKYRMNRTVSFLCGKILSSVTPKISLCKQIFGNLKVFCSNRDFCALRYWYTKKHFVDLLTDLFKKLQQRQAKYSCDWSQQNHRESFSKLSKFCHCFC